MRTLDTDIHYVNVWLVRVYKEEDKSTQGELREKNGKKILFVMFFILGLMNLATCFRPLRLLSMWVSVCGGLLHQPIFLIPTEFNSIEFKSDILSVERRYDLTGQ